MFMRTPLGQGEAEECLEELLFADGDKPKQDQLKKKETIRRYETGVFLSGAALLTYVHFEGDKESLEQCHVMMKGSDEPRGPGMRPTGHRVAEATDQAYDSERMTLVFDMDAYTPDTLLKMGYLQMGVEVEFVESAMPSTEPQTTELPSEDAQILDITPRLAVSRIQSGMAAGN